MGALILNVIKTGLPGVLIIEPPVFEDDRGAFMESWNADRYRQHGLPGAFVQSNVSWSSAGVVRGLHFQNPHGQGKLVFALAGRILDVAVDIRPDSKHFRRWTAVELSAKNHRQLYIPEGFAHGFCVLGESALVSYLCTQKYRAECDAVIAWNDPDIGIKWPVENAQLSAKDAQAPRLKDFDPARLPRISS